MKLREQPPVGDLRRREIILQSLSRLSNEFPKLSITEIAVALTRCRARRNMIEAVRRSLTLTLQTRGPSCTQDS